MTLGRPIPAQEALWPCPVEGSWGRCPNAEAGAEAQTEGRALIRSLGAQVSAGEHTRRTLAISAPNVRDFDEANDLVVSRGPRNSLGDMVTDTGSPKATLMVSSSGFAVGLAKHKHVSESGR